jgi:hypothetical protein
MNRPAIVAWALAACTGMRKSQAKTLAELTAAAAVTVRASLEAVS